MFLLTPGGTPARVLGHPLPVGQASWRSGCRQWILQVPIHSPFPTLLLRMILFAVSRVTVTLVLRAGHYRVVSVALAPSAPPSTMVHCGSHVCLFKLIKVKKRKTCFPVTRSTGHSSATSLSSGHRRNARVPQGCPAYCLAGLSKLRGARDHPGSQSSEGTSGRTDSPRLDQRSPVGPNEPSVPN